MVGASPANCRGGLVAEAGVTSSTAPSSSPQQVLPPVLPGPGLTTPLQVVLTKAESHDIFQLNHTHLSFYSNSSLNKRLLLLSLGPVCGAKCHMFCSQLVAGGAGGCWSPRSLGPHLVFTQTDTCTAVPPLPGAWPGGVIEF